MATYREINDAFQQQLQMLLQQEQDPVKIVTHLDEFLKANFDTSVNAFATMKKQEKDYRQTDPKDALFGGVRAMMQGVTLGLGDEVEAFLRTKLAKYVDVLGDEDKAYEQIKNEIQAGIKGFEEANPGWSFGLEMVGGFAIPYLGTSSNLLRAGVRGGGKLLQKALIPITTRSPVQQLLSPKGAELITQAGIGAGTGALYEYGKTDDVTATGTLLGAGFGAGGYKAGDVIGSGVRAMRDRGGVVGSIGQRIPDISGGGAPPDAPITKPPKLGEPSHDPFLPARTTDPVSVARDRKAMKEIIEALETQNTSFDELLVRLDDYVKTGRGEHVSIYDLATMPDLETGIPLMPKGAVGDLTLGNVLSSPQASGVGSRNMLRRALGAKDRAIKDTEELFGKIPPEFGDVVSFKDHLSRQFKERAKPFYAQADPVTINDPNLTGVMQEAIGNSPIIKKAFDKSKVALNLGGKAVSDDASQMTVQQFDSFKKALDSEISVLLKDGDWYNAGVHLDVKNQMLDLVDNFVLNTSPIQSGKYKGKNPYKIAREIYASKESIDMAFDKGRNAVANAEKEAFNEDIFINSYNKMSTAEKKMVILGLGAGLKDKLKRQTVEELHVRKKTQGGSGENTLQNILRYAIENVTLAPAEKIKWTKKLKKFEDAQKVERSLLTNFRNIWRGSQTAEKVGASQRAQTSGGDFVADAVQMAGTQSPQLTLANKGAGFLSGRAERKRMKELQKLSDAISGRLLSQGQGNVKTNIEDLRNYQRLLQSRAPQRFRTGAQNPLMYSLLDERY